MADDKDKKIGEVPHLEQIKGDEKIPVSAEGEARYIEVRQILDASGEKETSIPISNKQIDSLFPKSVS